MHSRRSCDAPFDRFAGDGLDQGAAEDLGRRIERARQAYDEATAAYEAAREQLFARSWPVW